MLCVCERERVLFMCVCVCERVLFTSPQGQSGKDGEEGSQGEGEDGSQEAGEEGSQGKGRTAVKTRLRIVTSAGCVCCVCV